MTAAAVADLPTAVGVSLSSMVRLYDVVLDGKGGFFQWGVLPASGGAIEAMQSDGGVSGSSPIYTRAESYQTLEDSIVPELLKSTANVFRCDGSTAAAFGDPGTRQIVLTNTTATKGLQTGDSVTFNFVQCDLNGIRYNGSLQITASAGDLAKEDQAQTFKLTYSNFTISNPSVTSAGVLKTRSWDGDVQVQKGATTLAISGTAFTYKTVDGTDATLDYLRGDGYSLKVEYKSSGTVYELSGRGRFYLNETTYLDVVTPAGNFPIISGALTSTQLVLTNTALTSSAAAVPTEGLLDGTGDAGNRVKLLVEDSGGVRVGIYVNDGIFTTMSGAALTTYWSNVQAGTLP